MDNITRDDRIEAERALTLVAPSFPTLPLSHRLVVVQDVLSTAREEARSIAEAAYIIFIRIGGDRNLRSYADTLVAQADRNARV